MERTVCGLNVIIKSIKKRIPVFTGMTVVGRYIRKTSLTARQRLALSFPETKHRQCHPREREFVGWVERSETQRSVRYRSFLWE